MKITNLVAYKLYIGFEDTHGIELGIGESVVVSDKHAASPTLKTMIANSIVSVSGYVINDSFYGEKDYVSAAEFNSLAKGLFVIPTSWTKTGTATASATPATITGGTLGPFDTTSKWVLKFLFDGLNTVTVELSKGQIDIATVVSELNLDTEFVKYGVASSAAGYLKISSAAVGTNSSVAMVDEARSAHLLFGMDDLTTVAPTGTVATVTIPTYNPVGEGLSGVSHAIKLYTTDFGGGDVVTAQYHIQRIQKGVVTAGWGTPEITITTDEDGLVKFEVAAAGAVTDGADWLEVVIPANYYFAQVPVARLQIA